MKVFVAGATGALGKQLVPQLVASGHEVVGMTRSQAKADLVRSLGARPALADGLDPEAVGTAVSEAAPDVIVHQLTALSGSMDPRHFDRDFALTNRLRTEGTDHLLSAGRAVGISRFVAQSFAGWPFARVGGPLKTEEDPLDRDPPEAFRRALDAIRYLEEAVAGADWVEGVVLRYGGFYGPGTSFAADPPGEHVEMIRKRKFPLVGDGSGVWSFVQISDAATATVAAVERGERGLYNIVDDDPAPVSEWLPAAAEAVGAKRPLRLPRWVGRLAAGEAATIMMTDVRGASNAKAKRELGWRPRYPSWRQGFATGLR
ncbi:MAG: NAD-dependent epimerase/dehydratase family protein [Solirubrobacterales bacterium]|nr:NAD-dependent epimerase/dehydratase family protein [Solirubrobacterales bacterium]